MQNLKENLEWLLASAEDCVLIGNFAKNDEKRARYHDLAGQLQRMAAQVRATIDAQSHGNE